MKVTRKIAYFKNAIPEGGFLIIPSYQHPFFVCEAYSNGQIDVSYSFSCTFQIAAPLNALEDGLFNQLLRQFQV